MNNSITKRILAFDPGVNGAAAYWNGSVASVIRLDNEDVLTDWLHDVGNAACGDLVAYLEQVGGWIGKEETANGSRMFTFGDSNGMARGCLKMLRPRVELRYVVPSVWMKATLPGVIGIDKTKRKQALKAYAARVFPHLNVTGWNGDALSLLDYAIKKENGRDAGIVVNTSGNFQQDAKAAIVWAKKMKFEIQPRGSKGFVAMVNYYCEHIKQSELTLHGR